MPRGGKREGAGKPKGSVASHTLLAQEMRRKLIEGLAANFDPILAGQIELAKGAFHAENPVLDEVTGNMVRAKIIKDKPDASVARYFIDQVLGKAKETVEVSGNLTTIVQLVTELEQ